MNLQQRALQIYPILINAAANRQVLTYKAVGDLIGMPPIALSQPLGLIMKYCEWEGHPPLTILVVSEKTGKPGAGLTTVRNLNQDRESVYGLNWYGLPPLTEEDFKEKQISKTTDGQAVALLAFGKEIDPAVLFPALTPEASQFVMGDPFAFALAISLDRGTKADIIWTIPYDLFQQLGHLDPYQIDEFSLDQLSTIINSLPRKPRYRTDAPRTIKELSELVVNKFDGYASRIWEGKTAREVKNTFQSLFGVGEGISNMAVLLVEKAYGIRFSDLDRREMDIKSDVHTMRVLYRLGAADRISEDAAMQAARELFPEYPGELDAPLWVLGREYCHAANPDCDHCPVAAICQQVDVD